MKTPDEILELNRALSNPAISTDTVDAILSRLESIYRESEGY